MKNFFKKLALVMALALVVTTLAPAAGVFAASKPALNAKSKTLLLNDEDRTSFDFNIKNKVDGSTYKWTTSNAKVAKVNAKNGFVDAVAVGKATIKVVITLPTKTTTTLSAKVTVKENIDTLTIKNAPEGTLAVGEAFDFNRDYTTVTGGKTTDITRWEVLSENKATATIDAKGVFVATAAGEYEIVAKSFQSEAKYADYLAGKNTVTATSKSVKVNVANTMAAKQYDLTSVNLTFGSVVTEADVKANVNVHRMLGDVKIQEQVIKSVKVDATGKVATVALVDPFVPGADYIVTYNGIEEAKFTAATVDFKDVVSMRIKTTEVTIWESTGIEVELLNKDGVIITTNELLTRVSFESSNPLVSLYGNDITFYTKGDKTVVTAIFHSYDFKNGIEVGNLTAVQQIVGVEKSSVRATAILGHTILVGHDTEPNFDKAKTLIAVDDYDRFLRVQLQLNNKDKVNNFDADQDGMFSFNSSNSQVLFVDDFGALVPLKAGTVQVTVEYNEQYVGFVTVTVSPKRVPANITASSYSLNLSNADLVDDKETVELKVVDQYGEKINEDINVEYLDLAKKAEALGIDNTYPSGHKLVVGAKGVAVGRYQYKLSAVGYSSLTRTLVVDVKAPNSDAVTWQIAVKAETDLKIASGDTVDKNVKIELFGMAKNGVKATRELFSDAATSEFKVTMTKPSTVPVADRTEVLDAENFLVRTTSGDVITKVATGRYALKATRTVGTKTTTVAQSTFTLVDTQAKPSVTPKTLLTTESNAVDAINEAFEIKLNGDKYEVADANDIVIEGTTSRTKVRINKVYVYENFGTYRLQHEVPVGLYLSVPYDFVY